MSKSDLQQLAFTMIRQARFFKARGQTKTATSLAHRARTIRAYAASITVAEPRSI